jgi:hypothetical protein
MPLTEFEVVDRQEHVDDSVVIAAKDGKDRVVAFVGREGLEDYGGKYFGRPHLSYEQRVFLLRSPNNLAWLAQTFPRNTTAARPACIMRSDAH